MSFIYNDKNFMDLIYGFNKKADPIPVSDDKVKQIQGIVDKVFSRLSNTNLNAVKYQKIDEFLGDLKPSTMYSLENFLIYLNNKKSEYPSGKIIVTTSMPTYHGATAPGYMFYKNEYHVNVSGLKGYLEYLKKSETYEKNSLFKAMVDALYKSAETEITGFKDSSATEVEIVHSFGNPIFLDRNIEENRGNILLLTTDLEGGDSLKKWITNNKIAIKESDKDITSTQDVICKFAQYLYKNVDSKFKSACESLIKKIPNCTVPGAGTSGATGQTIGGTTTVELNKKEAKDVLIGIFRANGPMYLNQIKFDVINKFLDNLFILTEDSHINSEKQVFQNFSNLLGADIIESGDPASIVSIFDPSNATIINETNNLAMDKRTGRSNVDTSREINKLKTSIQNMRGHIYKALNILYGGDQNAFALRYSSQNNCIELNTRQLDAMIRAVMNPLRKR